MKDSTKASRLVFIDLARCTAMVTMILAHVSDTLMDPELSRQGLAAFFSLLRGNTSALFLSVSGWSFAVATFPQLGKDGLAPHVRRHRRKRIALLFFWGYALTLPWWAEGFPLQADPKVWVPFFTFGVLHLAGTAVWLGGVLVQRVRRPERFATIAAVGAVGVLAAAPALQRLGAELPLWVGGALSSTRGFTGGFPLAPGLAYFFAGAALGALGHGRKWTAWERALAAGAVGLVAWAVGRWVLARGVPATAVDGMAILRLGRVTLFLAALALVSARLHTTPRAVLLPGKHALTFYVGHLVILYGTPLSVGLAHLWGKSLNGPQVFAVAAGCWVACSLVVWARGRVRALVGWWRERPSLSTSTSGPP